MSQGVHHNSPPPPSMPWAHFHLPVLFQSDGGGHHCQILCGWGLVSECLGVQAASFHYIYKSLPFLLESFIRGIGLLGRSKTAKCQGQGNNPLLPVCISYGESRMNSLPPVDMEKPRLGPTEPVFNRWNSTDCLLVRRRRREAWPDLLSTFFKQQTSHT